MSLEKKLSWKGKTARIAASVLLPVAGFLGSAKTARADESNYLPADFNKDGIVDVRDMEAFSDEWLSATEDKKVIPVDRCGCLDQAGATYVLMNDVTVTNYGPQRASCFTFSAEDINLDFNGHTILGGNPQSHYPEVLVSDNNGITIKNMTISNGSGIGLTETFNSTLENINSNTNQYGIYTHGLSNCKFENIETNSNSLDGVVVSGKQNILKNIRSNNNGTGGISITFDSEKNILEDIVTNNNRLSGLRILRSLGNTFKEVNSNNNLHSGLRLFESYYNIFENVELNNNGRYGVCFEDSSNNIIKDGRFNNPNTIDVYLKGGSHDIIFMNCNFDTEFVENESSLIRVYFYNVLVTDGLGIPVANAKVYGNRADGELEFMVRTGADGKTNIPLIDYINNSGVRENFSPYTITAEKDGLLSSHVYELSDSNNVDNFVLGE